MGYCLMVYGGLRGVAFDHQTTRFMLYFPDRGGEAIAAPRDRLDVGTPVGADAENLPEPVNVLGKVGLLDKSVRPDLCHQMILLDDMSAAAHEHRQSVEGFQSDG